MIPGSSSPGISGAVIMPKINDRFVATVRDVSGDGNGVVEHPDGQIFFVPGVWQGEEAEFCITGFRKRFGFARLVTVLKPSPSRVTPPCVHHGFGQNDCGGCPWQFVDYDAQLAAKEQRVRQAMARLGAESVVRPIWGSPRMLGYRNRAQFKTDGRKLGYVAQGSNNLVAIEDCPILSDINRETLHSLLATLPNNQWRPSRKNQWTTLDIDEDVTLETLKPDQRRPFRQANSGQNTHMRQWLAQGLAPLDKHQTVVELFAGSGNFTRVIADAGFEHILAVDAVDDAMQTLNALHLPGVETWACNLFAEDALDRLQRKIKNAAVLVLDPPRDGLKNAGQLLAQKHHYRDIFYISCDLATFERDLKVFIDDGFTLQEVQPLDQFPHTPHIELMALLHKRQ